MNVEKGLSWGLIPARGGSKSIPLKNLNKFGGSPLINYVIGAAKLSKHLSSVWCSTDDDQIAEHCDAQDVKVHKRPDYLSGDQAPVLDAMIHFLEQQENLGPIAEFLVLLQPTSPFTRPEDIDACIEAVINSPNANSAQTTINCPHNHHAINQRKIENGCISFLNQELRKSSYNKQKKPKHYLFGNVVVTRTEALVDQKDVFALPSLPIIIDDVYGFDADNRFDFTLGEFLMNSGYVKLDHLVASAIKSQTE